MFDLIGFVFLIVVSFIIHLNNLSSCKFNFFFVFFFIYSFIYLIATEISELIGLFILMCFLFCVCLLCGCDQSSKMYDNSRIDVERPILFHLHISMSNAVAFLHCSLMNQKWISVCFCTHARHPGEEVRNIFWNIHIVAVLAPFYGPMRIS